MSETALALSIASIILSLMTLGLTAATRLRAIQREHEAHLRRTYGHSAAQGRTAQFPGTRCDGVHPWDDGPRV